MSIMKSLVVGIQAEANEALKPIDVAQRKAERASQSSEAPLNDGLASTLDHELKQVQKSLHNIDRICQQWLIEQEAKTGEPSAYVDVVHVRVLVEVADLLYKELLSYTRSDLEGTSSYDSAMSDLENYKTIIDKYRGM